MVPTAFDEENTILNPPKGMSNEDCESISVWQGILSNGTPITISCWKITDEELIEIQHTSRVWLMVMGHAIPPSLITGVSPFKPEVS